jgi:predicted permease
MGEMSTVFNDIKYAVRQLLKNPGFTTTVVLILAVGIGANTAIFSIVNATLLRPLPYHHSEQLVQVKEERIKDSQRGIGESVNAAEFLAWQQENYTMAGLGGYDRTEATLIGGERAERVQVGKVTSGFFSLLGVQVFLGRAFLPQDDQVAAPPTAILSCGLWKRCFGADPNVIGKTVLLNDRSHTIIGVMPQGFQFVESYDIYLPLDVNSGPEFSSKEGSVSVAFHFGGIGFQVIGRLRPGVRPSQAQADLDRIFQATAKPGQKSHVLLVSLHEGVVGSTKLSLYVLLGAVGFVLLIACANVANLLLTRMAGRQKEMAIRAALGAGRWRIVRQLLIESVLLALVGGMGGLLLTCIGMNWLRAFSAINLTQFTSIYVDRWVLAFTVFVALATGLVFGFVPAWETSQVGLVESFKEGGRGTTQGRSSKRLRSVLVASEVGLSLVLLIGATLMARSFLILHGIDPGFRPDRLLSLSIHLSPSRYAQANLQAGYFEKVLNRLGAIPGVEAVAASVSPPLSHLAMGSSFQVEGRPAPPQSMDSFAQFDMVSADYFRVLGIPLRSGRFFTEQDRRGAPRVIIVNEALARKYFPDEDPIGKRVKGGSGGSVWQTIVGVVGDVHQFGAAHKPIPQFYEPYLQAGSPRMSIVARTTGDPLRLAAAVRGQIASLDKDQPVFDIQTLEQQLSNYMAPRRTKMVLLGSFAVLATVLAAAGIFAVISYTVAQRTHEIGVRVALGAQSGHILMQVVKQGMVLTLAGIGAGLLVSLWLTRYLASMLYAVKPIDPLTFGLVTVLLIGVALLACVLPARRAAKIDPMEALRYE